MKEKNNVLIGLAIIALMGLTLSGCKLDEREWQKMKSELATLEAVSSGEVGNGAMEIATIEGLTGPVTIKSVKFKKDDRISTIAFTGEGKIMVVDDAASKRKIVNYFDEKGILIKSDVLAEHQGVQIAKNGETLVYGTGIGYGGGIKWEIKDNKGTTLLKRETSPYEVPEVNPEGQGVVFGGADGVKFYGKNGKLLGEYKSKYGLPIIKISPNGEYVLVWFDPDMSRNDIDREVVLFKKDGKFIWSKVINKRIKDVFVSNDGRAIVRAIGGYQSFDLMGNLKWNKVHLASKFGFSDDGRYLGCVSIGQGGGALFINNDTGEQIWAYDYLYQDFDYRIYNPTAVKFSPDNKYLAFILASRDVKKSSLIVLSNEGKLVVRKDFEEVIGNPFMIDFNEYLSFLADNRLVIKGQGRVYEIEL